MVELFFFLICFPSPNYDPEWIIGQIIPDQIILDPDRPYKASPDYGWKIVSRLTLKDLDSGITYKMYLLEGMRRHSEKDEWFRSFGRRYEDANIIEERMRKLERNHDKR